MVRQEPGWHNAYWLAADNPPFTTSIASPPPPGEGSAISRHHGDFGMRTASDYGRAFFHHDWPVSKQVFGFLDSKTYTPLSLRIAGNSLVYMAFCGVVYAMLLVFRERYAFPHVDGGIFEAGPARSLWHTAR